MKNNIFLSLMLINGSLAADYGLLENTDQLITNTPNSDLAPNAYAAEPITTNSGPEISTVAIVQPVSDLEASSTYADEPFTTNSDFEAPNAYAAEPSTTNSGPEIPGFGIIQPINNFEAPNPYAADPFTVNSGPETPNVAIVQPNAPIKANEPPLPTTNKACDAPKFEFNCIESYIAINCGLLFLQPNGSDLYYGVKAKNLPVSSPRWKSLEITPDFHAGFYLSIRKPVDYCNTDVELSWEHLWATDTASETASMENMVGPYFDIGTDAMSYHRACGKVDHQFDAVNLHFHKSWGCEGRFKTTIFGGLDFARIEQIRTSKFSSDDGRTTRRIKTPSQFVGTGPGLGAEFDYAFFNYFSFTGESSISFLVGSLRNHVTFHSTTPLLSDLAVTSPNTQTIEVPHRAQVVPALCGKLGLSYKTCYCGTVVSIDVGYQAQIYLNAIQSVDIAVAVTNPPEPADVGVYALAFQRTLSDFILSGPYLNINIAF